MASFDPADPTAAGAASDDDTFFEAVSIRKTFGGVVALRNGRIAIRRGKTCGLLGANGSGKTTLSKIICGMHQPTAGDLYLNGERVVVKSPTDALSKGIAMVHQHLSLIPELTVWQNIGLGHEELTRAGFLKNRSAMELAEATLGRLEKGIDFSTNVSSLSPAKRQLVEIAKVLTQDPKLLILDEPTAALEQEEVERLFTVIRELRSRGVAIVFTSHRMWEVLDICDYVTVFRNGDFVGDVDFAVEGKDERRIIELITGADKDRKVVADSGSGAGDIEEKAVERLVLDRLVLPGFENRDNDGVSFALRAGEIVGVSGLQGQGQEELLLVLAGYLRATSGGLSMNGLRLALSHPRAAIEKGIVLVPGDRNEEGLFVQHEVEFNLNFPHMVSRSGSQFVSKKASRERSMRIIKRLNIQPSAPSKLVRHLSGGNQQKVVIGKWLDLEPSVLLLSDPAKGVDVQAKQELYQTVLELARRGTAVLLYASDNKELISACSRILVMFEGTCVEELKGENISDEYLTAHSLRARYIAEELGDGIGEIK